MIRNIKGMFADKIRLDIELATQKDIDYLRELLIHAPLILRLKV